MKRRSSCYLLLYILTIEVWSLASGFATPIQYKMLWRSINQHVQQAQSVSESLSDLHRFLSLHSKKACTQWDLSEVLVYSLNQSTNLLNKDKTKKVAYSHYPFYCNIIFIVFTLLQIQYHWKQERGHHQASTPYPPQYNTNSCVPKRVCWSWSCYCSCITRLTAFLHAEAA